MLGPILGGFLLTMALPNFMNFMVFAVAGLVAAIAISLIADKYSASAILNQAESSEADIEKKAQKAGAVN